MTDSNQKFESSSYKNKIKVEYLVKKRVSKYRLSTTTYTNLVIDKEPVFEKVHDRVVAAAAAAPDTPCQLSFLFSVQHFIPTGVSRPSSYSSTH